MRTPASDHRGRPLAPPLQGRGRGWGLSADDSQWLQTRAREMRRNPTEPEKRLWRCLSGSQLGGFKFRRQAVIGRCVADFLCPQKAFVVEVDGDTHDQASDRLRDDGLEAQGYRVLRVTNHDVMRNMDGVLAAIAQGLAATPDRWRRPTPTPPLEGEGLKDVGARKLIGISLEGSVG